MGVEVTQDEGVILGCQGEESVQGGRVVGRAGGGWGDVNVVYVYVLVVYCSSNGKVFNDVV